METRYEFHECGDVMMVVYDQSGEVYDFLCVGVHNIEFDDYSQKKVKYDEFRNALIEFKADECPEFDKYQLI